MCSGTRVRPAHLSIATALKCRCGLQVSNKTDLQVQCRRIMSALLPAAELLLRGVLDWRLKHWREDLSSTSKQGMVEEARCTGHRRSQVDKWNFHLLHFDNRDSYGSGFVLWVVAVCSARTPQPSRWFSGTQLGQQRVQAHGTCDAQSMRLGISVMRLVQREDERLAGLALLSSIRKRLSNLPSEVAADEMPRVRLAERIQVMRNRPLPRCAMACVISQMSMRMCCW